MFSPFYNLEENIYEWVLLYKTSQLQFAQNYASENFNFGILGTKSYDKIKQVLSKKSLMKDIQRLSPMEQTSALEGFHATLNQWHPKMLCFSWMGSYCR
jgi:hypothetical protein